MTTKDKWAEDESAFNYQKLEAGQEFVGVFQGFGDEPFPHVKFRVGDKKIGIPLYYQLERFLTKYNVQPGLEMKIIMKDKIELDNGRSLNEMQIYYDKSSDKYTNPE